MDDALLVNRSTYRHMIPIKSAFCAIVRDCQGLRDCLVLLVFWPCPGPCCRPGRPYPVLTDFGAVAGPPRLNGPARLPGPASRSSSGDPVDLARIVPVIVLNGSSALVDPMVCVNRESSDATDQHVDTNIGVINWSGRLSRGNREFVRHTSEKSRLPASASFIFRTHQYTHDAPYHIRPELQFPEYTQTRSHTLLLYHPTLSQSKSEYTMGETVPHTFPRFRGRSCVGQKLVGRVQRVGYPKRSLGSGIL
jgi:hypothetical protein